MNKQAAETRLGSLIVAAIFRDHFCSLAVLRRVMDAMILGDALKGISPEHCFLFVKCGVHPALEGGVYGPDVEACCVTAHLVNPLRRLEPDCIDLHRLARIDTSVSKALTRRTNMRNALFANGGMILAK